jgi:hypothetical protein
MILLCYQSSYMFQTSSNPHHIWFPILSNVAARKEKSGFQFPWRWNRWCNTDGREKDSFHFTVWRIVKCPGLHSRFAQCPTNASARRPARIYSWTRRTPRGNVGTWPCVVTRVPATASRRDTDTVHIITYSHAISYVTTVRLVQIDRTAVGVLG